MVHEAEPQRPRGTREIQKRMKQLRHEEELRQIEKLQTPMHTNLTPGTPDAGMREGESLALGEAFIGIVEKISSKAGRALRNWRRSR